MVTLKPQRSPVALVRTDRDFLPAALEILETPASPTRMWLIAVICSIFVISLILSWFGRIDIIAVAQGKIEPTGRVKVLQSREVAKVSAVLVQNGARVRQGDGLIQLDASDAIAERNGLVAASASTLGEIVRRKHSNQLVSTVGLPVVLPIDWAAETPPAVREREDRVYASVTARLTSTIASLFAQRAQKDAERVRLMNTIVAQRELTNIQRERVEMRSALLKRQSGTRAAEIDAIESYRYQQTSLAALEGQLKEAVANIAVIEDDVTKAFDSFHAENSEKLAEAEVKLEDIGARLVKAEANLGRLTLEAPIDGTVYALTVAAAGQVVMPAEEILRIVPEGESLDVEAYIDNKDIGFVEVGQEAVVKIDAFPFVHYGSIAAAVARISRDATPDPDAPQLEANPARLAARSTNLYGGQRVQNLVYQVLLAPKSTRLFADGATFSLSPGMTVTVEIKTGDRRILEYIFSPLIEVASSAMHER